ncbi:hypothetical protein HK099_008599, partial [Clydaea vesicula]
MFFALTSAGLYHTIFGIPRALKLMNFKSVKSFSDKTWENVAFVSGLAAISTVLALSGVYYDINVQKSGLWSSLNTAMLQTVQF